MLRGLAVLAVLQSSDIIFLSVELDQSALYVILFL